MLLSLAVVALLAVLIARDDHLLEKRKAPQVGRWGRAADA